MRKPGVAEFVSFLVLVARLTVVICLITAIGPSARADHGSADLDGDGDVDRIDACILEAGIGQEAPFPDEGDEALDLNHDAIIDADSHHIQQTVYLATGNDKPRDDTDYFKVIAWADPEAVRADADSRCGLESYADTPSYDQG